LDSAGWKSCSCSCSWSWPHFNIFGFTLLWLPACLLLAFPSFLRFNNTFVHRKIIAAGVCNLLGLGGLQFSFRPNLVYHFFLISFFCSAAAKRFPKRWLTKGHIYGCLAYLEVLEFMV